MGSFAADIPTSMTDREASRLRELAHGARVLEIGSLLGYSTIVLAQVAKSVVAVDPHHGYPSSDPRPTLNGFLGNIERYGVGEKVTPILGDGREVLRFLRPHHFDLIFIDITTCATDLLFTANNLDPRWIALHDYGHQQWTGATEAVRQFFLMRSYQMEIVDTLAVLDIGAGRDAWYE